MWFAGVTFDFESPASFRVGSLPAEASVLPAPQLPSVAHVTVESPPVGRDRQLYRDVRWAWNGDRARELGAGSRAQLEATGDHRYVARGLDTAHAGDLFTCLTGPALLREGGLVLHACGVEVAGGGLLMLGASGAGKTTAAVQTAPRGLLAKDQVAVFPADGRWWVAAMPGGTEPPCAMPPATAPCMPLRGALRVHKAVGEPRVQPLGGAAAAATVLGALRAPSDEAEGFARMLDAAHGLAASVPVGELHCVLGADLGPCIAEWLEASDG